MDYKPRAVDYEGTDNLVCPYCGHEQSDSWECADESDDYQCGECSKFFRYSSYTTRTYTSKKADCLNGAPHNWVPNKEHPDYPEARKCTLCYRRQWKPPSMEIK